MPSNHDKIDIVPRHSRLLHHFCFVGTSFFFLAEILGHILQGGRRRRAERGEDHASAFLI